MRPISKQGLAKLLGIAAISACATPTLASIDVFKCAYESGGDFGDAFAFAYDADKKSILLREHWAGAGFHPEFTLGEVRKQDGYLQFDFNYWNSGSVAMREEFSIDLGSMQITVARYLYDADGGVAGIGKTAAGVCNQELGDSGAFNFDETAPIEVSNLEKGATGFQPVQVDALYTPPPGNPLRATLMDTARGPISAEIGQRVAFVVSVFKTDGHWAYLQAKPVQPNGRSIKWEETPFAEDMRQDFMSDVVMILMRQRDNQWRVLDHVIGPTDVHWYGWIDAYNLPEALFAEHP